MSRLDEARARMDRKRAELERKKQWNHELELQRTPQRVIYQNSAPYWRGTLKLFVVVMLLAAIFYILGGH